MLAPIPGLEFFEDLHRYRFQGRWLPYSVSTIASPATEYEREQFRRTQHIWEPRGNAVHSFCEALLTAEALPSTNYDEWTDALQNCWLLKESKTLAVEYRLCDARKGVGGSFDFLLRSPNGKVVLGDLKTVGNSPAVDRRKPATAQLGGYLAMLLDHHPDLRVDWCYTLVSGPGRCRLIQQEPDECLGAWVDAWDTFRESELVL